MHTRRLLNSALVFFIVGLLGLGAAVGSQAQEATPTADLEANKELVRQLYEVSNTGDIASLDSILSPDYVNHTAQPGEIPTAEGLAQVVTTFRSAFPDLVVTVDDIFAEGDKVVARTTSSGTHLAPVYGIEATNKPFTVRGISIERIVDGRIVEHWGSFDQLSLLQQIGVAPAAGIPADPPSPAEGQAPDTSSTVEENKALVERLYNEVFIPGTFDAIDELFAADYTEHQLGPGQAPGLEGFKANQPRFRAAFPDLKVTVEDVLAEADRVAVRYSFEGTHQGTLFGLIPATGKTAKWGGMSIWRIQNGKIAERWAVDGNLSLLQQIGIIPPVAGPGGEDVSATPTEEAHDATHGGTTATSVPAEASPVAGTPVATGPLGADCVNELPATFIQTVAGADFMGCGILPQAPGQTLYLARFVLQPGQSLERHWHPGWGLIGYVESGVGSLIVLEGNVFMVRATKEGEPPSQPELIPTGAEIIAYPGDWVYYPEGAVVVEAVAGDEPVSTLIAGLAVTGQGPIDFMPVDPVVAEALADGVPANTPGQVMRLARFTLPPGSSVASHTHPGSELAYIQEGRVAMRIYSGEAVIRRAGSTTEEPFLPGEEVIFEAGDVMFAEEPMVHDLRNAGNDTAVILVTVLLDEDQEPVQFIAEDATPVATPTS
jgi:steroid delta-isomerase-like uncharacterized protein